MITSLFDKHVEQIGRGTSGTVYVYSKRRSGHKYAVKVYEPKEKYESAEEYRQRTINEYTILHQLRHINIISVYDFSQAKLSGRTQMSLEYCGRRTLKAIINETEAPLAVSPSEMLCFWKQVCQGAQYLHSKGISHRDLKFDNVLLGRDGMVKIIDFVDARNGPTDVCYGIIGTPYFSAPEVFSSVSYSGRKIDSWALGIMLYYILHKVYPWKVAKEEDSNFKFFKSGQQSPLSQLANSPMKSFLAGCLTIVPEKRVASSQFGQNSWFRHLRFCNGSSSACKFDHKRLYIE